MRLPIGSDFATASGTLAAQVAICNRIRLGWAMPYRPFSEQNCSIAAALEVVGERWTLLVMRDVLFGRRRFAESSAASASRPNILSDRLAHLVEHGLLERRAINDHSDSHEYLPDAQGPRRQSDPHRAAGWGDELRRARRTRRASGAQDLRPRCPPALTAATAARRSSAVSWSRDRSSGATAKQLAEGSSRKPEARGTSRRRARRRRPPARPWHDHARARTARTARVLAHQPASRTTAG